MKTAAVPAPPAWLRDRGLVATAVAVLLVVLVYGLDLLPSVVVSTVCWVVLSVVQVIVGRLCLSIAALRTTTRAGRRFWRLLATAAAMFTASSVVQVVHSVRQPHSDAAVSGTATHVALLAVGAVFLILAMLTSPLGLTSRRERTRFWLDAATVMVGVSLFGWQLTGLSGIGMHSVSTIGELASAVIAPATLVVVAFGVVKITMGGSALFTRIPGALGCLAAVLESVNTALLEPLVSAGHTAWQLGLGIMANLSFVAALRVQYLQSRSTPLARPRVERVTHSSMPYLAVAASYGLLIWVLRDVGLGTDAWVVLAGAIASSALVVARQLAAFADNDELLGRLNANIDDLAEAQDVLQHAIVERDELAGRLRYLAYHDSLTGLANRAMFLDRLEAALSDGGRPTIMIIDLDDFKPVNDTYGHNAGDTVLRAVAGRLAGCVRDGDTVARLGGDEFAALLPTIPPEDVSPLIARVSAAVSEPVSIGPTELRMRASIGTATAEDTGGDVAAALTALVHRADLRMYADKNLVRPVAR